MQKLDRLFQTKKLIVTVGSGGVGKTTTAATLAVRAAMLGRKTLVLTVDPARRLADALGLPHLDDEERPVDPELFAQHNLPLRGSLHAAMLDTKRSFDSLVLRVATSSGDQRQAQRILQNKIYHHISNAMAGTQEYVAIERVNDLLDEGLYDLIILDTPPTKNALDFLEAPGRLARFFDERVLRWFAPGNNKSWASALIGAGSAVATKLLSLLLGKEFVQDIQDFIAAIGELASGFRSRAENIRELLRGPSSAFVLVTGPERAAIDDAFYFYGKLQEYEMQVSAVVVNRAYSAWTSALTPLSDEDLEQQLEALTQLAAQQAGEDASKVRETGQKLIEALQQNYRLDQASQQQVDRLRAQMPNLPFCLVPRFGEELHDLGGLVQMGDYLFAPS